jgi:hypothetical protein
MVPLLLAGVEPGGDGFDAAMRQMDSCIVDAQFVRGQVARRETDLSYQALSRLIRAGEIHCRGDRKIRLN